VAYVGYLADVRGLREMIESIRMVNTEMRATLVLAGKMVSGSQIGTFEGSEHVEALGAVDRARVVQVLSRSRVGICAYHPTANYFHGQPTKLLEYMGSGLPVVASDFPFYRQVIGSTGCGLLVDPSKPAEIAEAIQWLLRNPGRAEEMGRRGRRAVLDRYNWELESKKLLAIYHALCS
jgi:glycosyltransferase involved in cell wall biosynthesis